MRHDPLVSYLDAIAELQSFVELAHQGVGFATVTNRITTLVSDRPAQSTLDKSANKLAAFAAAQSTRGFTYLYSLATVKLWSILEAGVDEFLLVLLTDPARLSDSRELRKLKGPLVEFATAPQTEQVQYLRDLLNQDVAAALKPGVGRFESVLAAVGFGGPVNDLARRTLLELSEVRNVILHRGAVVDTRFTERCPWLSKAVGDQVEPQRDDYLLYSAGSLLYMNELHRRWHEQVLRDPPGDYLVDTDKLILEALEHGWARRTAA